jgi:Tol biopolymer transport system component/tRNA A-37 threonylcarbamoyl transferase component Bud32
MHSPDALKAALADRYELLREIGRGGMATVYLARDVRHARQVAIKVLHPELAAVLGAERFLAEITTTANLQHPHILPLFDSGTADGQLFYVMPFVEGETLRARLDRETQLPIADAVQLAREVADALQYAHERGVIHRDIKPENILLQGGHALVADFGIALAVQHAGGQRMTQTGLSLGTPQYMAPEQAMGEKTIDARADIYALGAVTYEMLAGEPPFTGPTAQAIVAKVMTTTPTSLTTLRAKVPSHVDDAVQRALDKLPADRYTSARALSEALAGQYTGTAVDGTLYSGPAQRAVPPGSASGRGTTGGVPRWAFAVASCVALLSTGVLMWTRVRPSDAIVPEVIRQPLLPSPGAALLPDAVGVIAISPQGDRVAFVESDSLGEHIVIRRVSETIGRRVVASRPRSLAFSPDGQSLAFVSDGAVRRVSVDGGAALTLARLPDGIMRGMTWTERDTLVLGYGGLHLVPANPGNVVTIDTGGRWPVAIAPDVVVMGSTSGSDTSTFRFRLIAFRLSDRSRTDVGVDGGVPLGVLHDHLLYHSSEGAMMAVPFDLKTLRATGAPRLVLDSVPVGNTNGANAALSASGTLIYTRGDQSNQLVHAPLDGSKPRVLGTGRFLEPRYSPDGNRVAFFAGGVNVMNLPSGTVAQLTTQGAGGQPEWTPDGKRLLYLPDAAGRVARVMNADGSASADTIIPCPSGLREVVLSADEQWAVCRTFSAGQSDIFAVSLKTKGAPVPIVSGRPRAEAPRLSPNGRWLAFQSSEVGGQHEIFVTSFPSPGARVKISTNGGAEPLWDRTGRTLYFRQPGSVLAVGMDPASGVRTSAPRVVITGDYLIHPRNAHQNFDVAPDGRSLLLVRPAAGGPVTFVAHHWGEEFRAMLVGGGARE